LGVGESHSSSIIGLALCHPSRATLATRHSSLPQNETTTPDTFAASRHSILLVSRRTKCHAASPLENYFFFALDFFLAFFLATWFSPLSHVSLCASIERSDLENQPASTTEEHSTNFCFLQKE
jgi:hypothetical protein